MCGAFHMAAMGKLRKAPLWIDLAEDEEMALWPTGVNDTSKRRGPVCVCLVLNNPVLVTNLSQI